VAEAESCVHCGKPIFLNGQVWFHLLHEMGGITVSSHLCGRAYPDGNGHMHHAEPSSIDTDPVGRPVIPQDDQQWPESAVDV